ncbi:hypothetical protein L6164_020427 [Bauhinia variegata]|uniref:Uncharacterized protein n=1 Tax=Bauhinia variegata TaxID=167791 RepID=A0ACB9MWI2_BAUVA|nr:hypothetical protein L6164_020427 [Bauhinia variegata]
MPAFARIHSPLLQMFLLCPRYHQELRAGSTKFLKGTSIYLVGDSTEINQKVARELATGLDVVSSRAGILLMPEVWLRHVLSALKQLILSDKKLPGGL